MAALRLIHRRWSLVALLALAIASGVIFLSIISQNYTSLSKSTLQAKNAILALSELEGNLKDAETGQRGYLLTGNTDYLEPYIVGTGAAQANLVKLEKLILDTDAVSTHSLDTIKNFTQLKLAELDKTISLRKQLGLNAALPIVQSNAGKTYMDVIRQRSNRIRFAQESQVSTNNTILVQLDNVRNSVLILIALASSGVFWLLFQSFQEEIRLRKEVTKTQQAELVAQEQAYQRLQEAAQIKERELSLRIHDWKNPLTGILSSVEILNNYKDRLSQEKIEKHYKKIYVNIYALLNGFDDALLVAKAEAGKLPMRKESIDLVTIGKNSISAVESKIVNHTIKLYCAKDSLIIMGDGNLIQRAIVNLLENALKHTSKGEIGISLCEAFERPIIQVGDQGEGIPPEDLDRLFTAFERGNTKAYGTGLGLAVVKYCCEAHQGSVRVESQPGIRLFGSENEYRTVFTMSL